MIGLYRKCHKTLLLLAEQRRIYRLDDSNPVEVSNDNIQKRLTLTNDDISRIADVLNADKMVAKLTIPIVGLVISDDGLRATHERTYLKKSHAVFWTWVVRLGSLSGLIYGCIQALRFFLGDLC